MENSNVDEVRRQAALPSRASPLLGRWVSVLRVGGLVVAAAGFGCGSTHPTDATGSPSQCASPPVSPSDPDAATLLAALPGHHDVDGRWLNGSAAAVLTIDAMDFGERLPGSGTGCGASLLLAATVSVKTRDDVVDAKSSVLRFDVPWSATIEVPLPALPEAYAHPDASLPPLVDTNAEPQSNVDLVSSAVPTLVLRFAHYRRKRICPHRARGSERAQSV